VASELTAQLFAWLSNDLERLRSPFVKPSVAALSLIDQADEYLAKLATAVRRAIHPYRRDNPLALSDLVALLKDQPDLQIVREAQLNDLLLRLRQQGRLAGVVCHRDTIFIEEEHYSWKASLFSSDKELIARKAIEFIDTGSIILLDAGSTTTEIARQIGRGIKLRFWGQLTVVTNSISVANELLEAADEVGMEDDNAILRMYVAGGRIRPNTHAVIDEGDISGLSKIMESLPGKADIAFVGTNGICADVGFTTHDLTETRTKSTMLSLAARKVIVTDPSKFGIRQQNVFATFDDGVEIITTKENRATVERYRELLRDTTTKIITV